MPKRRILVPAIMLLLAGCNSNPPLPESVSPTEAPAPADYRALAQQAGARVFAVDPVASSVRIYAFRGGRAAFAGHNHVLSTHDFSGMVFLPAKSISDARFDLQFPLNSLIVDDAGLRQETGGAFATTLDDSDIQGTRAHMLGPDNLDAVRFPDLRVHATAIAGELPRLVATVALSLHGQTCSLLIPLEVHVDADKLRVSGSFAFRQTDFGVTPYSILGGLLSVQDAVSVDFQLAGNATPL
jgi:polyisoprenoid-binding protein YceI